MSGTAAGWHARFSPSPALAAILGGMAVCGLGSQWLFDFAAPWPYQGINLAAMVVGLLLCGLLIRLPLRWRWPALLAAAALLVTALFGVGQDGVRRWVTLGYGVTVQPAFLLLPLLATAYARAPDDGWHRAAMLVAAAAMALQPDRSMAAMLVAAAAVTAALKPTRSAALILVVTVTAFAVTLWRHDPLPAVPFVEGFIARISQSSWGNRALLLVVAAALLSPLADCRKVTAEARRAIIAFTLCWGTLFIASIIAPYPTPLLGYGASAIIGYFLSTIALRQPATNESP